MRREIGLALPPRDPEAGPRGGPRLGPPAPGLGDPAFARPVAAEAPAAAPSAAAGPDLGPDLAGLRVLLAEDNPTNQKVAGRMLDRLGCRFEVVANGVEALRKLDEAEYDVVLMDVQMPGMDGYQATAAIRRREASRPGGRPLPIIAMTAHAMHGDRERCLEARMNDYLSKPVHLDELARALGRWGRPAPPDPPEPPQPSTLRAARLRELAQGDADFEREILECLLADLAAGLDQLRAALDPLDPKRVATTLHGIVGACRTVGADALAARCREQEDEAKAPGFAPAPDWLDAIGREHAHLAAAVAETLGAAHRDRPADRD